MNYKIKKVNEDFEIIFKFQTQEATISIEVENKNCLQITSNTDGYHWFQYWLAQEPNCINLVDDLSIDLETEKVRLLFLAYNMIYEPMDKEIITLYLKEDFNDKTLQTLIDIIEPRFANRERYFNN